VRRLLHEEGLSLLEIGALLGLTLPTVHRTLKAAA
jgi:DNA-directed RNA polymerase specialized sigma24 family protein